jgi:hypothetical protein
LGEAIYTPNLSSGNFPGGASEHQVHTFSGGSGALTRGTLYVIEFENTAVNNYDNFISLDTFTFVPNAGISEDWVNNADWGIGINFAAGSSYENWGVSPGHNATIWKPCMEIHYANAKKFGFASVITGDIHDGTRDRITVATAALPVRARIQPRTTRTVAAAYIYTSARNSGAFTWALKQNTTVLASGSGTAVAEASTSLLFTREYRHGRIQLSFGAGVSLAFGVTYDLEITPTGATQLLFAANHDGRNVGYESKWANPEHTAQRYSGTQWVTANANPAAYGTSTALASYPIVLVDQ